MGSKWLDWLIGGRAGGKGGALSKTETYRHVKANGRIETPAIYVDSECRRRKHDAVSGLPS